MKKLFLITCFFLSFGLLAGCAELPFGIGELLGDANNDNVTEESEGESQENEEAVEQEADNDEAETAEEQVENETTAEAAVINECENRNHSRLTESDFLMSDFYVPDCAILRLFNYVTENNRLDLVLVVENGNREEIHEAYLNFFGDSVTADEVEMDRVEITAHPFGEEAYPTQLQIFTEDNLEVINLVQYLPE